jgi:uncharacterized membrane protein
MKLLKKEWLQLVLLAVPFCAAALLWNKLPERMPIHWDAHWQVNGFAGKTMATLLLPCLNIGLALLLGLVPVMDPMLKQYDPETRASWWRTMRAMRLAVSLFLCVIALGILAVGLKAPVNMAKLMQVGLGVLFILIGNLLTKLRPNHFFGVRTPWTLKSREVWMRTHRLAGHIMVAGGLGLAVLSLVVPPAYYFYCVFIPVFAVMAIVPVAYSYLIYPAQSRV